MAQGRLTAFRRRARDASSDDGAVLQDSETALSIGFGVSHDDGGLGGAVFGVGGSLECAGGGIALRVLRRGVSEEVVEIACSELSRGSDGSGGTRASGVGGGVGVNSGVVSTASSRDGAGGSGLLRGDGRRDGEYGNGDRLGGDSSISVIGGARDGEGVVDVLLLSNALADLDSFRRR